MNLDNQVKVTASIFKTYGSVISHNVLAINLCRDGNVLADGQAENIVMTWKFEAVSERDEPLKNFLYMRGNPYMAVLGDTCIFFSKGNSFHVFGSRGFERPVTRS